MTPIAVASPGWVRSPYVVSAKRHDESNRPPNKPISVLVIEDNPGDAELVEFYLQGELDCRFLNAATLAEAVAILNGQHHVDVLLLDLGLPDSRGLDGLMRLQEVAPETPVVVLSGEDDERAVRTALQQGAEDFVNKDSLEPAMLRRTLRHALERNEFRRRLESVSERLRVANAHLQALALTDPLTELPNRRGIDRALELARQSADRYSPSKFAIFIDIDDFKAVNDKLGHGVGDLALREIGRRIRDCLDARDIVGRVGGDEFLVVIASDSPTDVRRLAERVRLAVSSQLGALVEQPVRVSASIGVDELPDDATSIDEIIGRLRGSLAAAKRGGKNRVSWERQSDLDPHGEITEALRDGTRFRPVLQPIVRLRDNSCVGYELLSRLDVPVLGMPSDFFRISAEANLLTLTDTLCLASCIAATRTLAPDLSCHLNILPSTLVGVTAETILQRLREGGARPYCLELSEQQILGPANDLVQHVHVLRSAGIHIAIDDVGFGNSCLESLIVLEPEIVKIDRRCLVELETSASQRTNLKRMLAVARALGAEVIAEGVETGGVSAILVDLGVKYAQGFLWGRPD